MKRILFLLSVILSPYITYSQLCNENASKKAKEITKSAYDKANHTPERYDSLRKELSAVFEILESCVRQNPSYEAQSKVEKIYLYFAIYEMAKESDKRDETLKLLESLDRLLPSPNAISTSAASSYTINGSKFTVNHQPQITAALYYMALEKWADYYYFNDRNYKKLIEYYEKISGTPSSYTPDALPAMLYADALYKTGKPTEEYYPALSKAMKLYGAQWAKKEEHDSAQIRNMDFMENWLRREINSYNKPRLITADPKGNHSMDAARGLWDGDVRDLAKQYALLASENGHGNKENGYWYMNTVANKDPEHMKAALTIIEKSAYGMSENEMQSILPTVVEYGPKSFEEIIRSRLKKIEAIRRRSTVSLYPAIELVGLPFGHVPVSLNLRTGRIVQEFRFDYAWGAKSKYRFGRAFAKGDKGERYEFSGWDVGYSLTGLIGKDFKQGNKPVGRSKFYVPLAGIDLRFANWNFTPTITTVKDAEEKTVAYNSVVNAKTHRYEGVVRLGFMYMTRFLTLEVYTGVGVGYRKLLTNEGWDTKEYTFDDPRLSAQRWNKVYMPLRLGIKVGFNVL